MQSCSAPLPPRPSEDDRSLKERRSAPSHLISLASNEAPPFRNAEPHRKPELLIWTFINEKQAEEVTEVAKFGIDELRKALECLAVNNNFVANSDISEKQFLSSLLVEAFRYGEMLGFDARRMSTLLTIYANSHKYFRSYYWLDPSTLWAYFKELVFRHSIDDSPDGEEVFEPEESCDILSHFHTVYVCNLPLIHIRTFRAHRLKLSWPFQA